MSAVAEFSFEGVAMGGERRRETTSHMLWKNLLRSQNTRSTERERWKMRVNFPEKFIFVDLARTPACEWCCSISTSDLNWKSVAVMLETHLLRKINFFCCCYAERLIVPRSEAAAHVTCLEREEDSSFPMIWWLYKTYTPSKTKKSSLRIPRRGEDAGRVLWERATWILLSW